MFFREKQNEMYMGGFPVMEYNRVTLWTRGIRFIVFQYGGVVTLFQPYLFRIILWNPRQALKVPHDSSQ